MMKKVLNLNVTAKIICLCAAFWSFQAFAEPFKIGFVMVGPIDDGGWSEGHYRGIRHIEKHFGDKIEVTFYDNIPEGIGSYDTFKTLAADGMDMIFATSFGFNVPAFKVAKEYPNIKFEHTGTKTGENFSVYAPKLFEARYVSGKIAAQISKTKKLGFVGSFPLLDIVLGINAIAIGAQEIDPNVTVEVIWAYTWLDEVKESEATKTLLSRGVDIILQNTDTSIPCLEAERRNAKCFGQNSDVANEAKNAIITSVINNWGPFYIRRITEAMNGTWEPTESWPGLKEDILQFGKFHKSVPKDIVKDAQDTIDSIINEEIDIFDQKIYDQQGKFRLDSPSPKEMRRERFFIKGVIGSL